ncbi:MAG: inositol monophosphatase [Sedimentisphaerales bacterium]|nr:inositol monophosphatase [Sedimentisphaerales bacterium]
MRRFLREIIRHAGHMALEYQGRIGRMDIERKSETQLVTQADRAVEAYLIAQIKQRYPGHAIVAEESGEQAGQSCRWLIDPIDGTTSFVHGQPFFAVSVGVERQGQRYLGMVYLPALNELFEAEKGQGALCNDAPIAVSSCARLSEAVLATHLGCRGFGPPDDNLAAFAAVKGRIQTVRILGSAALHLCYVADGRLDGYWQRKLQAYDAVAGMLIVEEAGGTVSDFGGGDERFFDELAASNGFLHAELLDLLGRPPAAGNLPSNEYGRKR